MESTEWLRATPSRPSTRIFSGADRPTLLPEMVSLSQAATTSWTVAPSRMPSEAGVRCTTSATSRVRSCTFRPIYKWFMMFLVVDVIVLGFCGAKLPDDQVIARLVALRLLLVWIRELIHCQ